MRIATWNVNSLNARMPWMEIWLDTVAPHVLCLQETKLDDASFPADTFTELGYESVHHGQGQWNGVAILSRVGIDDPSPGFSDGAEADPDARMLWATCGGVRVGSVYVPNGRTVDDDHYQYKLAWLARLRAHLDAVADPGDKVCVLGDFNIIPETRDMWDPKAFEGATHVTDAERAALDHIIAWGLTDVFREQYDDDGLYSYWDYTAGRFHKRQGIRIDLALASAPLLDSLQSVVVDRNARKNTPNKDKPSDHAPLVVDFHPELVSSGR